MKNVFIGLGNPGPEYAATYHNVGILALEKICPPSPVFKSYKDRFEYLETSDTIFVRSLTYMNNSGMAAKEAMKMFGPATLYVLHDDSDLIIGTYKISVARGAAGHKGVQSIIDALGTNDFTRIRIGIRPARERVRQKAGEFALKHITKGEMAKLKKVFEEVIEYYQSL